MSKHRHRKQSSRETPRCGVIQPSLRHRIQAGKANDHVSWLSAPLPFRPGQRDALVLHKLDNYRNLTVLIFLIHILEHLFGHIPSITDLHFLVYFLFLFVELILILEAMFLLPSPSTHSWATNVNIMITVHISHLFLFLLKWQPPPPYSFNNPKGVGPGPDRWGFEKALLPQKGCRRSATGTATQNHLENQSYSSPEHKLGA